MKKLPGICALVTMLLGPAVVHSGPVKFGLAGGPVLSRFVGADSVLPGQSQKFWLTGEIRSHFRLGLPGPVGIQGEVGYTGAGARHEYPDPLGSSTLSQETRLDYFKVAALGRLRIMGAGPLGLRLIGGPYVAALIGAKVDIREKGKDESLVFVDIKDALKGMDMGAVFGLGAGLGFLGKSLDLEFRVSPGFAKVFEPVGGIEPIVLNLTLSFTAGMTF